jgi:hypothetical protein
VAARSRRLPAKARRFYEEALTQAEQADFPVALEVEGIDQEIALLRLRLRGALQEHPEDLQLMLRGIALLVRALAAKYRLPKADQDALAEAVADEIEGELWPKGGVHERGA